MKPLIFIIAFVILYSNSAFADSLFNESACPVIEGAESFASPMISHLYMESSIGVRCEDWKSLDRARNYIGLALMPASIAALRHPALGAELAAAGLTFANPAVLSVTLVGAVGIATFNIILNASLEECARIERDELKNVIMKELEQKFGMNATQSNIPLELKQ